METEEKITLITICGGAAQERFDYELQRVLDNINDPNYEATAIREVSIVVKIKPDDGRETIRSEMTVKSKFAPLAPVSSFAVLGKDVHGRNEAHEIKPAKQLPLPLNVKQFKQGGTPND